MTLAGLFALALIASGCTSGGETPEPGRAVSSPQVSASPDAGASPETGPPPVALVFWSGRIAHPLLNLRTWGRCAFKVGRVTRVDAMTLRVVGRETDDCASQVKRHITDVRLTKAHAIGGKDIERVVVVSRNPAYRVEARTPYAIS